MIATRNPVALTLGPLLFNWPATQWRDFYFRVADEAPVDTVYLGEVVCSKRMPLFAAEMHAVVERLERSGKQVIRSTLALVLGARDGRNVEALAASSGLVEANDMTGLLFLRGRPHVIGPFVNVYNEAAVQMLVDDGAVRICLPPELPHESIAVVARAARAAGAEVEVFVYGRLPLALSARCYHARVHGLDKEHCQFICDNDPDGLMVRTLDDEAFLAVNGIQTLSYTCANLLREIPQLTSMGVSHLRISPHSRNIVEIAGVYRRLLDAAITADEAWHALEALSFGAPFANGFFYGAEGVTLAHSRRLEVD
jgi:O2-independent ubiquinone biosynthesis protein UbiV